MGTRRESTTFVLAIAALALACSNGDETAPAPTREEELVFEVFHASIDGVEHRRGRERFELLAPALAATPDDVVCLQGVGRPEDRRSLTVALARVFPFSLDLPTDDDSRVDDPRDVTGRIPEAVTAPPCEEHAASLGQYESCLVQARCLKESGGTVAAEECLSGTACVPVALLDADPERRCVGCLQGHARSGASVSDSVNRCMGRVDPLVLGGQHGMILLSKLPLTRPTLEVLPATGTRRAILGATLTSARGIEFDVVCTQLGPTATTRLSNDPITSDPYPGVYGSPRDGWLRENELHIERLAAHVTTRRGARPAIVMGNFGSGVAIPRSGGVQIPAAGPIGAQRLSELFASGVATAYTPSCTVCRENPLLHQRSEETFLNSILLAGLPSSAVHASTRTQLGNVVPARLSSGPGPDAVRIPLSVQYGFRSRIGIGPR